jgi:hypothetical protein
LTTPEQFTEVRLAVKSIESKLTILRNFLIVANEGVRQQQSAANDEILLTLRDISSQLSKTLRAIEGP